jgi:hypothetical protein
MGLGNDTAESVTAANERAAAAGWNWHKALPPADRFSPTRAEYILSDGRDDPKPSSEALAPLDALHSYHDANRERLVTEYHQREAENAAREQWLKENPPVPKDTVINFWPKKSRNYSTGK